MEIAPTFYFRPLSEPIQLSYVFNIKLRNPNENEIDMCKNNLSLLASRLSNKEKRRILYTLHPLGISNIQDNLEEIFINELSKIWVIACAEKSLPFEQGLTDYGALCGFSTNNNYTMNPVGFIIDIKTISPRLILRALKQELPKAAYAVLNNTQQYEDLIELEKRAAGWDGLLIHKYNTHLLQTAQLIRQFGQCSDIHQRFLHICTLIEILITHNPSKEGSKHPINRQFSYKSALVRNIMVKNNQQNNLQSPIEIKNLFHKIYDFRSQLIHGRAPLLPSKRLTAKYINELYPTLRLILKLQTEDPLLTELIKSL
ncbi:MAG: hypothetical protein ACRCTQ_05825 [Brevinemataceae bacterium]